MVELGILDVKYQGKLRYLVAKEDQSVLRTERTAKEDRTDREGGPIGPGKEDQSVLQVYHSKSLSKSPLNQKADFGGNELILPFSEPAFAEAWKMWKQYKKAEFGFWFKSQQAEQLALVKLKNDTQDANRAITAIGEAMACGWKSIQPPKARSGDRRAAEEHNSSGIDEAFAGSNF
jgi:hypothetical protein